MAIGVAFGLVIDNLASGVAVELVVGLGIGAVMNQRGTGDGGRD